MSLFENHRHNSYNVYLKNKNQSSWKSERVDIIDRYIYMHKEHTADFDGLIFFGYVPDFNLIEVKVLPGIREVAGE